MANNDINMMPSATYAVYAEATPGARFSDWLRARAEPDWSAAVGHRFTVELAEDRISDAVYRRYLIQDYAFIETLVGIVGFAVGRAPSMDRKLVFAGFLAALTGDEDDYFRRSFDALGVAADDRESPPMGAVTIALRDLMLGAVEGGYAEVLAVLLPAEWIYLTWAQAHADRRPDRFYLKEWIDLHTIPEFGEFVDWMRGEMDAVGPSLSADRQSAVAALFCRMAALEVAFFDAAYEAD
jgi:thiaminase (transcriptional activator TenA)